MTRIAGNLGYLATAAETAGSDHHTSIEPSRSPFCSPNAERSLIGKTRAVIVSQLDLPMTTTQLACQLNRSAPTLSVHLGILRAAGVVDSRRDGRAVPYHRTRLGDHLLATRHPHLATA